MRQETVLTFLRLAAWLSLGVAPVFVTLGILHRTPEWALSGVALVVYGLLELRRVRHARGKLKAPADPA